MIQRRAIYYSNGQDVYSGKIAFNHGVSTTSLINISVSFEERPRLLGASIEEAVP